MELFAKSIADFAEKMTALADSAADPSAYVRNGLLSGFALGSMPYELDTTASFQVASFNGRALGDDVLDVMLTLVANTPLVDGLAPDSRVIRKDFPYYGAPHTTEERLA